VDVIDMLSSDREIRLDDLDASTDDHIKRIVKINKHCCLKRVYYWKYPIKHFALYTRLNMTQIKSHHGSTASRTSEYMYRNTVAHTSEYMYKSIDAHTNKYK
jgi:hypothetical protein